MKEQNLHNQEHTDKGSLIAASIIAIVGCLMAFGLHSIVVSSDSLFSSTHTDSLSATVGDTLDNAYTVDTGSSPSRSKIVGVDGNKSYSGNDINGVLPEKTPSNQTPQATDNRSNPLMREQPDGTWVYIIQPNDTLSHISAAFGYSVDKLANTNDIDNVDMIYDGSALQIPQH